MIDAFKRASAWRINGRASVLAANARRTERQAARSDLREARCVRCWKRWCEPRATLDLQRAADSRLFRTAPWITCMGSPLAGGTFPHMKAAKSDGRFAGCSGVERAGFLQETWMRRWPIWISPRDVMSSEV